MALVFGYMPIEEAWRFAPISEFDPETRDQVYEAVGERVLASMFEDPDQIPEQRAYLVEISDKRIVGFPCVIAGRVSPIES